MKSTYWISKLGVCLSLTMWSIACGGGEGDEPETSQEEMLEAVEPPEFASRPLPGQSGAGDDEVFEQPDGSAIVNETPEDRSQTVDSEGVETVCCEVTFAVRDLDGEDNEERAVLVGSGSPFSSEGLPLTFAEGVWSARVCVPPEYAGTYHYAFSTPTQNGGTFEYTTTNDQAPRRYSGGIRVNAWEPAQTCGEIDVSVHAKTQSD